MSCISILNNSNYNYVYFPDGSSYEGAYCTKGCNSDSSSCETLPPGREQIVYTPQGASAYIQYTVTLPNGDYIGDIGFSFSDKVPYLTLNSNGGTATIGNLESSNPTVYPINFSPAIKELSIQNTSDISYVFLNSSQDALSSCYPSCAQILNPGDKQSVLVSEVGWIDLEYVACNSDESVSSCDKCSTLGSFGITIAPSASSEYAVSNVYDGIVTLSPISTTVMGVGFATTNSPCPLGTVIPKPQTYATMPYRGVNLAGCEFETFYPPCPCNAVYFVEQGATTIRLPVHWEYLQPGLTPESPPAPIDFTQGDALVYAKLVNSLTDAGLYVIIDMHNYMRYNASSPGIITGPDYIIGDINSPGGLRIDQYVAAWESIAKQFVSNPLVMFDLMNEPNGLPTELILENYNAVIPAIRSVETAAGVSPHLIHLEGNAYTCLGSWTQSINGYTANSDVFIPANIKDPSNYYTIHVHEYLNGDELSQACGSGASETCVPAEKIPSIENIRLFSDYLKANQLTAFLGETNGAANENCAQCVYNLLLILEYISETPYGFIGWTGWSGGSFGSSYLLSLTPTYDYSTTPPTQIQTMQMVKGFNPFMTPL